MIKELNFKPVPSSVPYRSGIYGEIQPIDLSAIVFVASQEQKQEQFLIAMNIVSRRDVKPVPEENFSFVKIESPIIAVLQRNRDLLRLDLDSSFVVDGRYYLVANDLIDAVVAMARKVVDEHPSPQK